MNKIASESLNNFIEVNLSRGTVEMFKEGKVTQSKFFQFQKHILRLLQAIHSKEIEFSTDFPQYIL